MFYLDLMVKALLISSLTWILTQVAQTTVFWNRKPFNCTLCLGFWLGLLFFSLECENKLLILPLGGFTSLTTVLIDKWINKLY